MYHNSHFHFLLLPYALTVIFVHSRYFCQSKVWSENQMSFRPGPNKYFAVRHRPSPSLRQIIDHSLKLGFNVSLAAPMHMYHPRSLSHVLCGIHLLVGSCTAGRNLFHLSLAHVSYAMNAYTSGIDTPTSF